MNLIGNAVKFTDSGEIRIGAKGIEIATEPFLKISIADSGIGMRDSDKDNLFQVFSQANLAKSTKYKGTGLGLNISRRLAQALGGDLVLENSALGKGSIFALTLPLLKVDSEVQEKPKVWTKTELSGKSLKILLAEDSPDNQTLVKVFLTSVGFDVETANNGREAVDKALKGNFDGILMDIEMPEMNGYEATDFLHRRNYKKPIIALTAHALTFVVNNAPKVGFAGYIVKPIRKDNLVRSVLEIIAASERA